MIVQSIAAWLHFAAIFVAVAALATELTLYRRGLTLAAARVLGTVDAVYGAGAGLIIATGIARVIWFAKGPAFYLGSPLFWVKIGLVAAIALLSIPPTLQFLRWRPVLAEGRVPDIPEPVYRRTRRILWIEAALFLTVPLLAALMARGVGL